MSFSCLEMFKLIQQTCSVISGNTLYSPMLIAVGHWDLECKFLQYREESRVCSV